MQNDMRDGLINLIIEAMPYSEIERQPNKLADYLIANGVIVPPCKVGDTVWVDDFMWGLIPCKVDRPYHCTCGEKGGCTFEMSFTDDDIGKTVFLKVERVPTKDQAEQKLKELSEQNG